MTLDDVWLTPEDAEHIGVGRQAGPLRLDWGPTFADLKCDRCGAEWLGKVDDEERCWWCWRALERQRQWQAELVLRPPDVDPDDEHYRARMTAWRERLRRAVDAELITDMQGRRAWERATRDTRIPDRRRTGQAA